MCDLSSHNVYKCLCSCSQNTVSHTQFGGRKGRIIASGVSISVGSPNFGDDSLVRSQSLVLLCVSIVCPLSPIGGTVAVVHYPSSGRNVLLMTDVSS